MRRQDKAFKNCTKSVTTYKVNRRRESNLDKCLSFLNLQKEGPSKKLLVICITVIVQGLRRIKLFEYENLLLLKPPQITRSNIKDCDH